MPEEWGNNYLLLSYKSLIKSNCPYLDSAFFMNKIRENPSLFISF